MVDLVLVQVAFGCDLDEPVERPVGGRSHGKSQYGSVEWFERQRVADPVESPLQCRRSRTAAIATRGKGLCETTQPRVGQFDVLALLRVLERQVLAQIVAVMQHPFRKPLVVTMASCPRGEFGYGTTCCT